MQFTSYIVKDGQAVPENPFRKPMVSEMQNDLKPSRNYFDFETWKQSHTYATNAKDGVYTKESFDIVWQYYVDFHKKWRDETNKSKSITFEEYSRETSIPTRKFLKLKVGGKEYWHENAKSKLIELIGNSSVNQLPTICNNDYEEIKKEAIAKLKRQYETGKIGFVQALEMAYDSNKNFKKDENRN